MKTLLRAVSLSALVLASLGSAARAMDMNQMESPRWISFGIGGGVSVPVADAKDAFKTGYNGQGFVRFNLHGLPIQPRIEFSLSHFDLDEVKVGTTGTGQVMAGLANLEFPLLQTGPIRPYIVAGVGAYNLETELDNATTSASDTKFGVNGGGGVMLHFGHTISAYAEARVDNVFTDEGFIDTKQIQVVPVTFGVVF
jgi:opacity protein-like surface antigen